MEEDIMTITEVADKNGTNINNGDTILYNGKFYMVMAIGKDSIGYIAHPIGNTEGNDLLLEDIHNQVEVVNN